MAEEKVSTLAELYDRTRKCTGIKIPNNALIYIDVTMEDFKSMHSKMGFGDTVSEIVKSIRGVSDALMIAGVGEISVLLKGARNKEVDNISGIMESLEYHMESFKNSRRPMCRLKFKDLNHENEFSGEYEAAVVISGAGNSPRLKAKSISENFKAKKVVVLLLGDNGRHREANFSRNIYTFANIGQTYEAGIPLHFYSDSINSYQFDMNYRIIMQAMYMLCSEELESLFKTQIMRFDTLKSDGALLKNILQKFQAQGLIKEPKLLEGIDYERAVVALSNFPFTEFRVSDLEEDAGTAGQHLTIDRVFEITKDTENALEWFDGWIDQERGWSNNEWSDLVRRERKLAGVPDDDEDEDLVDAAEDAEGATMEAIG